MSSTIAAIRTSRFQMVLASVESLPTDDQAILAEVVANRVAAKRRRQLVKQIEQARHDYRQSKVRRGTAADLMAELRR
jgi:hypothetical protein